MTRPKEIMAEEVMVVEQIVEPGDLAGVHQAHHEGLTTLEDLGSPHSL